MSVCYLQENSFYPIKIISKRFFGRKEMQKQRACTARETRIQEVLQHNAVNMSNKFTERLDTGGVYDSSPLKKQLSPTVSSSSDSSDSSSATGTQVQEQSDSDYEDLEDVLHDDDTTQDMSRFGRAGTKHAAMNWFKQTQLCNVKVPNQSKFAEWFHGIISRKEAERLLKGKMVGCFLIRVSESRFGYSLSFKAEKRCRHYMIDQLRNEKFAIIGEPKFHSSLHDLIDYHMKVKISNWNHFLTVPCGQDKDESDYAELVNGVYFELDNKPQVQEQASKVPDPISCGYSLQRPNRQSTPIPILHKSSSTSILGSSAAKRPLPKLPEKTSHKSISTQENICRSLNDHASRNNSVTKISSRRRASVF